MNTSRLLLNEIFDEMTSLGEANNKDEHDGERIQVQHRLVRALAP